MPHKLYKMLKQRQTSLLDLSNELLFEIVSHVPAAKNLMMTCHRLYNIVYPHFFDCSSRYFKYPLMVLHWAVVTRNEPLFRIAFRRVDRLLIHDPDEPYWLRVPGWLATPGLETTVQSEYLDKIMPRIMEKASTIRLDYPAKEGWLWGQKHIMSALRFAIQAEKLDMVRYFTEVLDPAVMYRSQSRDIPFMTALIDWEYRKTETIASILKIMFKTVHPSLRIYSSKISNPYSTPLHWAVHSSWEKELRLLVSRGALFSSRDCEEFTPLMIAVNEGNEEMLKVLIELNPDSFLKQTKVAVAAARKKDNEYLARYMIAESLRLGGGVDRVYGWSALHMAVKDQDEGLVEELLGKGMDVGAQDNNGRTPLHLAVNNEDVSTAIVMLLIMNGSKVSAKDYRGKTPLHLAINQLSLSAARALLHAGAAVNAKDRHGNGPLEILHKRAHTQLHSDFLSILSDYGAVPATKESDSKEPKAGVLQCRV